MTCYRERELRNRASKIEGLEEHLNEVTKWCKPDQRLAMRGSICLIDLWVNPEEQTAAYIIRENIWHPYHEILIPPMFEARLGHANEIGVFKKGKTISSGMIEHKPYCSGINDEDYKKCYYKIKELRIEEGRTMVKVLPVIGCEREFWFDV